MFFFFKQKTAYEMRISDWSSDVCSSDLDVEQEIKNTDIENADLAKELEKLLFDGVIKQRKIRHSHGQDYPYTRKLDDRVLSREHELAIHVISPLTDGFDDSEGFLTQQRMQRSEEHTSELQSLMRISYAVFCLKKKKQKHHIHIVATHYTITTNNT